MSVSESEFTILRELGGAEKAGDPERLFGAFQGLVVGREVGLGERQLQVTRAVCQAGILLTLEEEKRKEGQKSTHFRELAEEIYGKRGRICQKHFIGCRLRISHDWDAQRYRDQSQTSRVILGGFHVEPRRTAEAAPELPHSLDWFYCVYFGSKEKLGHASFIELFSKLPSGIRAGPFSPLTVGTHTHTQGNQELSSKKKKKGRRRLGRFGMERRRRQ